MRAIRISKSSVISSLLSLAVLAAIAETGWGQQHSSPPAAPSSTTTPDTEMVVRHNAGDQAFVKTILERDQADLQLAQLAQSKSQSDDIKSLAQQITGTRTSLENQLKVVAKQIDVSVPKNPTKKDKQAIAKLDALSGAPFEEAWLQMLAKSHRQDVKDFQGEAANAQEPSVLHVAQPDADVLLKQLQSIELVAQSHNVTLGEK